MNTTINETKRSSNTSRPVYRNLKRKILLRKAADTILLLLCIALVIMPLLWLIQMSFRDAINVFRMPPPLFDGWTLSNYIRVGQTPFLRHLLNSVIVSTSSTTIALIFGVPTAYALSRYRFRRENVITFWILGRGRT